MCHIPTVEYYVIGSDGNEYGPADTATLKTWVQENRLSPQSQLRVVATGQLISASQVTELFPSQAASAPPPPTANPFPSPGPQVPPNAQAWSQPPSASNYPHQQANASSNYGGGALLWAFLDSAFAVIGYFFLGFLGLIFGAYAIVNAVRAKQAGHPLGNVALVVAILSMGAVLLGYAGVIPHVNYAR